MLRIQQSLIAAQELGDEKLQIVTQMQDLIDQKTRQLDQDFKNLDYGKDEPMLDLQQKEQQPVVASSNVSSSLASPSVNASNATPSFIAPSIAPATSCAVSSTVLTPTAERFATSVNSTSHNNNERTSKRARRARNETGTSSGNGTETTTTEPNVIAETTQSQNKQSIASTSQSTAATQKKANTAAGGGGGSGGGGKKKKRKSGRGQTNASNVQAAAAREIRDDTPPPEEAIDPDEPTYCLCDQISFGEMILCDNDLCPIEWFHFSCVSLMSKPKGKWFCPNCRGDRPNVMKPKAQFLKELERYNKEKEEKT